MHNNSFFKPFLLLVSIVLFVSCDKDYNEIGDALIGENHFDLAKYTSSVVAYNEKITPIQSENLAVNALGIYDNPAFGKTTASFATQVSLASLNPTINPALLPEIDNVYIDVPYFVDASQTKPITTGGNTYELDSIYGAKNAKIKLSIYESARNMEKQRGVEQLFYTNQNTEFDGYKIEYLGKPLNNDSDVAQNDAFFFDNTQHSVTTKDAAGKETTNYTAPSMRLKLNNTFFKDKILNAPAGSLATDDVFKDYFRGLYFKVEQSGTEPGSLAMINFAKGTITIKYKENTSSTDPTRVEKSIILNLTGYTASLLEKGNPNSVYETAISSPDRVLGDDKLYLKGGEGSLAVIELFDKTDVKGWDKLTNSFVPVANKISDELEDMRHPADGKNMLINNANLVFNIDASAMANSYEPDRIYLYDFTNSNALIDYFTAAATTTKSTSKFIFGGFIQRDPSSVKVPKRGVSYKIDITNHIRNLIKSDDVANVKLGVVVTEDINNATSNKLRISNTFISQAPKASVMNPLGTILYGGKSTSTNPLEDKRLKLEIYFTKPN